MNKLTTILYIAVAQQPISGLDRLVVRLISHTPITNPLNEGSARLRGRYLHYTKQVTNVQALSGIQTYSPSNQVAAVLRLRPHGHRGVICVVNNR